MLKLSSHAVKAVNACTGNDVEVKLINGTYYRATLTVKFSKYSLEFCRYYYPPKLRFAHGKNELAATEATKWIGYNGVCFKDIAEIDPRVHGVFQLLESNTVISDEDIANRCSSLKESLQKFKEEMGIH